MNRFAMMATATLFALLGCASQASDGPVSSDDPGQSPRTGQPGMTPQYDVHQDPTIRRLEEEAMALAKTTGCTTLDQCRAAPVGSRACGGPRYYLPYCRLTTDSAALFSKLAEVKRAEEDYNRRNQIGSTCEFRMPPELEVAGGACRARVR
jgi:hypothetical protein